MSVHQLMLRSVACLPIRSGARTSGVLYLEHRSLSGRFEGADLMMLPSCWAVVIGCSAFFFLGI